MKLRRTTSDTWIPIPVYRPRRLWRPEAPACFRPIKVFDLIGEDNDKYWWDPSSHADRKLVYERLLTYGDEGSLRRYLDAALLIGIWPEWTCPSRCAPSGRRSWRLRFSGRSRPSTGSATSTRTRDARPST